MQADIDSASAPGPAVLTIEEAAAILRIGRNAAYALARLWRETDGREGLPVIALGRTLRVPAAALAEMLRSPTPSAPPAPPTLDGRPLRRIRTSKR